VSAAASGIGLGKQSPHAAWRWSLRAIAAAAVLLVAALASVRADERPKLPEPLYETRAEHSRDGIGKFFLGREIAHVMGHQASDWLERPEREQEE